MRNELSIETVKDDTIIGRSSWSKRSAIVAPFGG